MILSDSFADSWLPHLCVGDDQSLYLCSDGGETHPIVSPWCDAEDPLRLDRIMAGGWIYYAAYPAPDHKHIEICFVSIYNLCKHVSWTLTVLGQYVKQSEFSPRFDGLFLSGRRPLHCNPETILLPHVAPFHNDLAIYQFYRYVVRSDSAAENLLRLYMPRSEADLSRDRSAPAVHLLVVYNHNYSRNVPEIDALYIDRFSSVLHVLPNVAPPHPRCMAVPFGSYSYHVAVSEGLRAIQQRILHADDVVLIVQDDVMLHPRVCQQSVLHELMSAGQCCAHPSGLTIQHDPDDAWIWNDRVGKSCILYADHLVGSGFESLPTFFEPRLLTRGVSDIFALRGSCIGDFLEVLGLFISRSVFPEVSIPSSLKLICRKYERPCAVIDGLYLWGKDRSFVEDDEWLKSNLIDTSHLFLHPVKIARQGDFS